MRTSVTVYLDWVSCAQFAGLFWADAKGLYAAAGLDVTLVPWHDERSICERSELAGSVDGERDTRSVIEKVLHTAATGQLCVGSVEDNLLVRAAADDVSVRAFGAMLQDTPMVLMSHPEQTIRSFTDLRGKRVGMHTDGIRALEVILALEGISSSELDIREVGFDLDHLVLNHVDVLQGYTMTEPFQLGLRGFPVDVLAVNHAQLHPYAQIYFAERSQLIASRDTYAAFLSASTAGWMAVCDNPDEAAAVVATVMNDSSQAPLQRAMLDAVIPLVAGRVPSTEVGRINADQWRRNLETYFAFGFVKRSMELSEVAEDVNVG